MLDVKMIERGLEKTGKSKGGLAKAMGVRPGAVSELFSGIRLIKASEIEPIIEYLRLNYVPIMGRVGAGAVIEPEHEQVPPEGLGEVELPFPFSEETIAFEVAGDSMLPKYENGDIIVVYKEQRHPVTSFYGEEAAVRLKTGERYLKTIERGKSPSIGQPHQLQRQADQRGETGMDRGNLRYPAQRPDRPVAGQGRRPGRARRPRRNDGHGADSRRAGSESSRSAGQISDFRNLTLDLISDFPNITALRSA